MKNKKINFKKSILPLLINELIALAIMTTFFILSYYFTSGIGYTFSVIFEILTNAIAFISFILFVLYFGLRRSEKMKMTPTIWNRYYRRALYVTMALTLLTITVYILLANYSPHDYIFVRIIFIFYDIVIIVGVILSPIIYLTCQNLLEIQQNYNQPIITYKNDPIPPADTDEDNR